MATTLRRLAAVLMLGALLAGTAQAGHGSVPGWHVDVLQPGNQVGGSFSEPGLAAGPDGQLLANACTANAGGPSTFWRSVDNGRSWSRGFGIGASPIGCGDADSAIGPDGYHYALTLGAGVDVYRSRNGRTWSGPATFPPPHGEDQPDRPWLVTVPTRPNEVHLFNSELAGNVVEWTSLDHGASFAGPVPVTGGVNSQAVLALSSRPITDPTHPDRLSMLYETAAPAGASGSVGASGPDQFPLDQLWLARSDDRGQTWTNTLALDVTTAFATTTGTIGHLLPAVTIDRRGNVYVVLSVQLGKDPATHLYLLRSRGGSGWSRPVPVEHAMRSNVMPAVTVGRPGELYISWYASEASSFTDSTARWSEWVASTDQGLSTQPAFRLERLSGIPPVHVGAVDVAGAVGSDLGQNWALRDFQSATTDSCGLPHITWAADYSSVGRTFTARRGTCPGSVVRGSSPAVAPAATQQRPGGGVAPRGGAALPVTGGAPLRSAVGLLAVAAALALIRSRRRLTRR